MTPDLPFPDYTDPPLRMINCQFTFTDSACIRDVRAHQKLRNNYPVEQRHPEADLELASTDGREQVLLSYDPSAISLCVIDPDVDSPRLTATARELVDAFRTSNAPPNLIRLELQYSNLIILPEREWRLEEFFTPVPRVPDTLQEDFNRRLIADGREPQRIAIPAVYSMSSTLNYVDPESGARFTTKLWRRQENEHEYRLAIVAFIDDLSTPFEEEIVSLLLTRLTDVVFLLFNCLITDRCKELFGIQEEQ
jgi:uncharacterized protein (TIGR04255 family)